MLRRTFLVIGAVVAAVGQRLRGQTRENLNQMANRQLDATPYKSAEIMEEAGPGSIAGLDRTPASLQEPRRVSDLRSWETKQRSRLWHDC